MHSVRAAQYGDPDVMKLEELPTPTPGRGQVLVRVRAAGVNYIDIYHRTGQYPTQLPVLLGLEGAGAVEAVGEGADARPGEHVAWSSVPGSYSTHVLTAPDRLVPVPESCDLRTAAALMLQGMTAHALSTSVHALGPKDTCLIHAAAGGVGQLLVQMAARAGARVIATVSTKEKAEKVKALGAADVILYKDSDFEQVTRRLTSGRGVDVVYDSVGKDTFLKSLGCLRPRGLCVLYGQASGAVPPFEIQTLSAKGSLYLTRPKLGDFIATREELLQRSSAVFGAVSRGELKVEIGAELPLASAADAHRLLGGRETTGKVLLLPA
jgi:NADPH:quinone reductase